MQRVSSPTCFLRKWAPCHPYQTYIVLILPSRNFQSLAQIYTFLFSLCSCHRLRQRNFNQVNSERKKKSFDRVCGNLIIQSVKKKPHANNKQHVNSKLTNNKLCSIFVLTEHQQKARRESYSRRVFRQSSDFLPLDLNLRRKLDW